MSGLFVSIASPTQGAVVGRRLRVTGAVSLFSGRLTGLNITFPGGVSFGITLPVAAAGKGGGSWAWEGLIPNPVRPGQSFTITVSAFGLMKAGTLAEPEMIPVDGTATRVVTLENVVPKLSVEPFQSPVVTADATYAFTLRGQLTESVADPYNPRLTYRIGSAAPVSMPLNGAYSVPVSLPPGDHVISVTGTDAFASSVSFSKTLTVLRYDRPANLDASLPKTAAGIPTTASVTSWTRLEPQCAGADMEAASAARLFDPLWLMTRQWQVGEFQGEDAGSPVQARARMTTAKVSRYHAGELTPTRAQAVSYNPAGIPLEVLAEQRRMRSAAVADLKMLPSVVDAGLHFLNLMGGDPVGARHRAAFSARYPLAGLSPSVAASADPETRRFAALMAGRVVDARRLAAALRPAGTSTTPTIDPALGIPLTDVPAVQAVAARWLDYQRDLFNEPRDAAEDAWTPPRLEYALSVSTRFSAAAGQDVTLSAAEFDGGRLDWSSFDVSRQLRLDNPDAPFAAQAAICVPARVTFKGTPAQRFWEMEDANVAYGLLSAEPSDLAHLMMIEYAHSYGNDWFVVPVTTTVGSLTRVDSLVVTDTFGVRSLLRPIGDPALQQPAHFSMWQAATLAAPGQTAPSQPLINAFFLPPTLGQALEGSPLEDVAFMRDEMGNLAWGIERTVEGGMGAARSLDNAAAPLPPATPAEPGALPRYLLSSTVPEHWIPLMPAQVDDRGTVRLKRARTLQPDGTTRPHGARSEVLTADPNLSLFDEEVPREGVRITRRRRMARWIDGSTWVWTAYRNEVGRGEGSAGLVFDDIKET